MTPSQDDAPSPALAENAVGRRRFLRVAVLGSGAVVTVGLLGTTAGTVLAPVWAGRGDPSWVPVGPLDGFALGEVTKAVVQVPRDDWAESLRARGVFVWRAAVEETVVFSRACTDLGCPVTWDPGSSWYFCPCHGAIFDREGVPQKGPPKRPLHRYATRVQEGVLQIDLNSVPPLA
jgi:menaquinol-cytochrome c reductase iron-sulfur subunit